jgi:hypothetical protein
MPRFCYKDAARGAKKGWTSKAPLLGLPPGTAEEILDELREDR